MKAAAAAQYGIGWQAYNSAIRKERLERIQRCLIIGRAILRHDDRPVGDAEIHVARRDDMAVDLIVPDRGHECDLQPEEARAGGGILIDGGVGIVFGGGLRDGKNAGCHEAGEIVDMTIGMVVEQPIAEPEHVGEAQRTGQQRLDLFAIQRRISVGIEQTLFGGDEEAGAIGIDRPAFQDDRDMAAGEARGRGESGADVFIARHPELAAPAVELEIDEGA